MGTELLEGGHDPILPSSLCDAVGLKLKNRSDAYKRTHRKSRIYLISDMAHCAVCGIELKGNFQDGRRLYRHQYARKADCKEKWTLARNLEEQLLNYLFEIGQGNTIATVQKEAEALAREAFTKDSGNQTLIEQ